MGALVGGVLTRKVEGMAAGAALGALGTGSSSSVPLPLDQALQILLSKYNIEFLSLVRRGPFGADLSIRMNGRYRILRASVLDPKSESERDDKLYDEFERLLVEQIARTETGD